MEKSKYINKNKLIIIFIGLFVFVLITEYFMNYNEFFEIQIFLEVYFKA